MQAPVVYLHHVDVYLVINKQMSNTEENADGCKSVTYTM